VSAVRLALSVLSLSLCQPVHGRRSPWSESIHGLRFILWLSFGSVARQTVCCPNAMLETVNNNQFNEYYTIYRKSQLEKMANILHENKSEMWKTVGLMGFESNG
jgi:hypothetical protein